MFQLAETEYTSPYLPGVSGSSGASAAAPLGGSAAPRTGRMALARTPGSSLACVSVKQLSETEAVLRSTQGVPSTKPLVRALLIFQHRYCTPTEDQGSIRVWARSKLPSVFCHAEGVDSAPVACIVGGG